MSVNDRLNLVFQDADIIPLFIQENYPHYRPFAAKSELDRLELVAKAARNIAEGDVMNKSVRVKQNWGLMPYANIVSAVMPASALRGPREVFGAFPGERNFNRFPGWLGKNSTHGKNKRLLREIHAHATSASSGEDAGGFKTDAAALREAYLPVLKTIITAPMRSHAMGGREKEGIEEVMATMDAYGAKPPPPPSNCQAHPSCVPPPGGWTIAGCVNQGCQLCRASGNGTAALGRAEGDPTCDYGSCGCSKCCSGSAGPCKLVKDWYCSL